MTTLTLPLKNSLLPTLEKEGLDDIKLELSETIEKELNNANSFFKSQLHQIKLPIFGLNIGLDNFSDNALSKENALRLQHNLIVSHACGTGKEIPLPVARLFLLFKISSLCNGNLPGRLEIIQRLIDFFNNDAIPEIFEEGSSGSSGDIVCLAHLSLPLIGLGSINFEGKKTPTATVLKQFKWKPLSLNATDAYVLLQGNEFSKAFGVWNLIKAKRISQWSDFIASVSYDAFEANPNILIVPTKKDAEYNGQQQTFKNIQKLLTGSGVLKKPKNHGQDPYCFKGIAQIHGAFKDILRFIEQITTSELEPVSSQRKDGDLQNSLNYGCFKGLPLAQHMDYLGIAATQIGNLSEIRIRYLLSGKRGLPPKLINNSGLNTGLATTHYVAVSIVSKNKTLAFPASIDLRECQIGKEDHVIIGSNSATKTFNILENIETILGLELINAAQALEFRKPQQTSKLIAPIIEKFREKVPFIRQDEMMGLHQKNALLFIQQTRPF